MTMAFAIRPGSAALSNAITNGDEILALSLIPNSEVGEVDVHGQTPLMWACIENMPRVALALLATGNANPKQINNAGSSALTYAYMRNMTEVIAILEKLYRRR